MPERQNRRRFVQTTGASLAAASVLRRSASAQSATGYSPEDYLNYILNLEYLQAEFYSYAVWGIGIDQFGVDITGSGAAGPTTGLAQISFSDGIQYQLAQSLFNDELDHVVFLRSMLANAGATPIAKPAFNFSPLGSTSPYVIKTEASLLVAARGLEDLVLSAYNYLASVMSQAEYLAGIIRILATEAEHTGALRLLIGQSGITQTGPFDGADIVPPPTGYKYFSTDSNGLTEARTPEQVAWVAFLYELGVGNTSRAPISSGGVFPNGFNGNVTVQATFNGEATLAGNVISAAPNPAPSADSAVTLSWNASSSGATEIEIRIDSPAGPLFTRNAPIGQATTGNWVNDGMTFFLQDADKPLTLANTLAVAVVHVTV